MNHRFPFLAAALFSGFLFWSWGGVAGWRTLQMMPAPGSPAFSKAAAARPAKAAKAQARVELSRRMESALQDPAKITKADVSDVKAAFGKDAGKMLNLLKESSR